MGHTAPEPEGKKPAEAPQPSARPTAAPQKKGGFTTLSAAEYRAMAGLTAPVPVRPLPDVLEAQSPATGLWRPALRPSRWHLPRR